MEAASQPVEPARAQAAIVDALGLYRAEYTDVSISRVFTEPVFWQALSDRRPTFLIGGRGTGKTMALRMLAYDGQQALHGNDISSWPVLGIYWRISVLSVTAFRGARIPESDWVRVFAHWVNLQLVDRLLQFFAWRTRTLDEATQVSVAGLKRVSLAMGFDSAPSSLEELHEQVMDELVRFEAQVNSLTEVRSQLTLSMLGSPLRALLQAVSDDPVIGGRNLTVCIDEFENLEHYQQRVFNTLLKHVGDVSYTLKIGVKPTGIRDTHTLNEHESISEVADYTSLEIVEHNKANGFADFATRVCRERLNLLPIELRADLSIPDLLGELTDDQEAELLGVDARLAKVRERLIADGAFASELEAFAEMSKVSAYLVHYWARSKNTSELRVLRDAIERPTSWKNRVNNYGYSALFTIRDGAGPSLRKYYAGWSTYLLLADGNIRHLLDLVTTTLLLHVVEQGNDLSVPVDPSLQTRACSRVGEKLAFDLEGKDGFGKQIMTLVLGIGRVFGVMARDPWGHTPEVNQFEIDWSGESDDADLPRVIDAAVMHSGLVRFPGDKRASSSGQTRDYDFQLHPIFAPYFVFSHRRKRRLSLRADDLLALASPLTTTRAIERILISQKRATRQYSPGVLFDWPSDG